MAKIKKYIGKKTPHKKAKSIDESPIKDKSNEFEEDIENPMDIFYDAVEEDDYSTPVHNKCLIANTSILKPNNTQKDSNNKKSENNEIKEKSIAKKKDLPTSLNILEEEGEVRKMLPCKRNPKHKTSIWTVLKDMIGKDLTRFAVPVYFNEPITMLQRIAEVMENEELLITANKESNSLKRLVYVSIFNAVQYNTILGRKLKPSNPILGETFEYVTKKYRFFSEQVSHHPPISACVAESSDYEIYFNTNVKIRFWMKSLEFVPLGKAHVILKPHNEHYIIDRPNSLAQNIIIGTMYLDTAGDSMAINTTTNEKCFLTYHGKGWTDSSYSLLDGYVLDSNGKKVIEITGKWTESIWMKDLVTGNKEMIWKRLPAPEEWEDYYCFPLFPLQLNNLTDRLRKILPPTDSRFRPDP